MNNILLETRNITKCYSNHKALDNVSISIPEGCIYGLLGPNGAGKTTLIRIINRITAPDEGTIIFNGEPLKPDDVYKIGYLPEERGLYKKMKVGEHAIFLARLKGLSKNDATQQLQYWFEKFEIKGWWNRKIEELSKGMAQKVQFIVTVLHKPKLLIFDEPFSGFDPLNTNMLKEEILTLKKEGTTIIFSTHNMSSVEEICDNITLINKSKNVLSGNVAQIKRQYGSNTYQVDFIGDKEELIQNLSNKCEHVHAVESQEFTQGESVRFTLNEHINRKDLINLINDKVDLHNFREIMPSMNDIFIKVVTENNTSIL